MMSEFFTKKMKTGIKLDMEQGKRNLDELNGSVPDDLPFLAYDGRFFEVVSVMARHNGEPIFFNGDIFIEELTAIWPLKQYG